MLNIQDKYGNRIVEVVNHNYDAHIHHVALNLRAADFDEVFAETGESPHLEIEEYVLFSLKKWVILNKHSEAVAILGVRPLTQFSKIGIPWLLGTDGLGNMKRFFVSVSRPTIENMKGGFDLLINHVDARYTKAVRWLEWCGFTVEEPKPHGVLGEPFHKFYMECS
jgi:hypothetical protein